MLDIKEEKSEHLLHKIKAQPVPWLVDEPPPSWMTVDLGVDEAAGAFTQT